MKLIVEIIWLLIKGLYLVTQIRFQKFYNWCLYVDERLDALIEKLIK